MKNFSLSVLITLLTMVIIDAFWLGTMYKRLYAPNIGHLLGGSVKILPAVFFYLLYALALYVFVIAPEHQNREGLWRLFWMGVLFGLVTYGTYDLTNQAALRDWPWVVTVVDMLWGAFLTGVVSVIANWIIYRVVE